MAATTLPVVDMTVGELALILVRASEHIAKGNVCRLRNARLLDEYAMPTHQRTLSNGHFLALYWTGWSTYSVDLLPGL